jgi:hypothetical protein
VKDAGGRPGLIDYAEDVVSGLGTTSNPRPFFNWRVHSLARGNVLVLLSLAASVVLSDFPHNRPTLLHLIPALAAAVGTAETARCMRRRWDFYHAGVILCIYMDLMAMAVILFLLFYPYWHFLSVSR